MPTRIYDSSQLTKRRQEKAVAGSFLSRLYPPSEYVTPQQGSAPLLGILDSSIINTIATGKMTEYTDAGSCYQISPGCPCSALNSIIINQPDLLPGAVSGITFTVGSIIVSWNAPTTSNGPFTYIITPYLNGMALTPVTTTDTTYRFTNLESWQPYTFTVCAMNGSGQGPIIPSSYFLAPPDSLSYILEGTSATVDYISALKYVLNNGINNLLEYAAKVNLGPTKGSRFMYVWITSIIGAWNWVRAESRITGIHDNWNWSTKSLNGALSNNDSIIWLCNIIDYVTPFFIQSDYKTIYNCPPSTINRVKEAGDWNGWVSLWQTWYNYRVNDGSIIASTLQPTSAQNLNSANPIIVDGVTDNNINGFPAPHNWSALWLKKYNGVPQKYMTYTWDSVLSSCLTEAQEAAIQSQYTPLSGAARDAEIDAVINITSELTDEQKCCAEFWAGGPGTVSPPLMFIWLWKEYVRNSVQINNSENIMYSLLDLAIHLFEGGRVTWRLKAAYMEARPIQEIRRRYGGQMISSWNGVINGAQWIPYQTDNFVTPPFADFPSGHSHFSTAFSLTMEKWFGANITPINVYYDKETLISPLFSQNATQQYGTFTIESGKSEVQPDVVPNRAVTLEFGTWDEISSGILGAGISRLYGGIHCNSANIASQQIATDLNTLINTSWNINTV